LCWRSRPNCILLRKRVRPRLPSLQAGAEAVQQDDRPGAARASVAQPDDGRRDVAGTRDTILRLQHCARQVWRVEPGGGTHQHQHDQRGGSRGGHLHSAPDLHQRRGGRARRGGEPGGARGSRSAKPQNQPATRNRMALDRHATRRRRLWRYWLAQTIRCSQARSVSSKL
jgi:hypothetical protein